MLNRRVLAGNVKSLVVIAAPRTLGELRKEYHNNLEAVLIGEMLTCMKRAFELLAGHKGIVRDLATIPSEDPRTYAMIRTADTLGTFHREPRADGDAAADEAV